MVSSETNTGKVFERFLSSNVADILTPLVTMTRICPRPPYAQGHFDQPWADFQKLGRYFSAQETLN